LRYKREFTLAEHYQLRNSYENCLSKMNALADRTSKALIKFARTRSIHEFLKTQRFLLSSQDDDGNTPIHLSILYGNLDLLAIFVEVSATISFQNIINIKNNMHFTPLMIACYLGEIDVCEYLLEANADMSITDLYGSNPIHVACKTRNLGLLKVQFYLKKER
jgi:nuclear factor of kappa light polypeptide gene enhancer in B-cells 2